MILRTFLALAALATLPLVARSAVAQDVAAGQKLFRTNCAVCHAIVDGRKGVGPSLFGVVGRTAGSEAGYSYSPANKASGLKWDAATLDRYLKAPRDMVPGTKMTYAGMKDDAQRTALIAYLATVK